jgi:sialate O-acetylesterase
MVLQRDCQTKIWGWAMPGEKVTVSFDGQNHAVVTGANGKWAIAFSPLAAGGPYRMEISASNHIVLQNVLVGDVWVCSGQSNMVLPMERVKERYPEDIAKAENPMIRQFFISTRYDFKQAQEDLPPGRWEPANPKTVLQFSATGYFFARTLFERYHVPIGLINASVGGSPVEAWLSGEALKSFPSWLAVAEKFRDDRLIDSIRNADHAVDTAWNNNVERRDAGLHEAKPWYDEGYDAAGWQTMKLPGYWDEQGLKANGAVWFRKEIEVPTDMTDKPAKLMLGRIVDRDVVYVNGVLVGTTGYQYPPRTYELPANLLRPGKNVIVIRVINNSGRGGFIKDKPYALMAGGRTIDLKGDWQWRLGVAVTPLPGGATTFQYQPVGLYNGMIAPLTDYTLKGVIWYQGESNAPRSQDYRDLFSALIVDWRKKWGQGNFPFLFVQLPNYGEPAERPGPSQWAGLREAQLQTLSLPNTGMAVTIDIGEWNDIHPLDKEDVGRRLALVAERVAYGEKELTYSGPLYQSAKIEGNKIRISFSNIGSGLAIKAGGEPRQLGIAGADKKFVRAKGKIEGNTLVVWSDDVASPLAVRYAWADNPEGANLFNREGLPASPFRTDD